MFRFSLSRVPKILAVDSFPIPNSNLNFKFHQFSSSFHHFPSSYQHSPKPNSNLTPNTKSFHNGNHLQIRFSSSLQQEKKGGKALLPSLIFSLSIGAIYAIYNSKQDVVNLTERERFRNSSSHTTNHTSQHKIFFFLLFFHLLSSSL
jgi:hypothetical protein